MALHHLILVRTKGWGLGCCWETIVTVMYTIYQSAVDSGLHAEVLITAQPIQYFLVIKLKAIGKFIVSISFGMEPKYVFTCAKP